MVHPIPEAVLHYSVMAGTNVFTVFAREPQFEITLPSAGSWIVHQVTFIDRFEKPPASIHLCVNRETYFYYNSARQFSTRDTRFPCGKWYPLKALGSATVDFYEELTTMAILVAVGNDDTLECAFLGTGRVPMKADDFPNIVITLRKL